MTAQPLHPVIAVSASVWNPAGEILMIQRDKAPGAGLWSLPGGKLELFECLQQGVMREVHEETGVVIDVGPLVEAIERMSTEQPSSYHYVILHFVARIAASATSVVATASSDARQARFIDISELEQMPAATTTDGLLPIVHKARALAINVGWISQ